MSSLSKIDRFYLRHLIRTCLVDVNYDAEDPDFLEVKELFRQKYDIRIINKLVKEVLEWQEK